MQIYYANNATSISAQTAGAVAWVRAPHDRLLERGTDQASGWQIGPSLTPLTNLNSGFRVYEVDSGVRIPTVAAYHPCLTFSRRRLRAWTRTREYHNIVHL